MDVVLLRWPLEAERRQQLAAHQVPRLVLVEGEEPPPTADDCLEDWMRMPAPESDVRARMEGLSARSRAHQPVAPARSAGPRPRIDECGVLDYGQASVPLPPVDARLAAALVERFGAVVGADALLRAGWPGQRAPRNALHVHILRLRRRLTPVGLSIRTVRSRGYMLEAGRSEPA